MLKYLAYLRKINFKSQNIKEKTRILVKIYLLSYKKMKFIR